MNIDRVIEVRVVAVNTIAFGYVWLLDWLIAAVEWRCVSISIDIVGEIVLFLTEYIIVKRPGQFTITPVDLLCWSQEKWWSR